MISLDLRTRLVAAVQAGSSRRAAAARFGVSASCVAKLLVGCVQRVRPCRGDEAAELVAASWRCSRRRWFRWILPWLSQRPQHLVFIDETAVSTKMRRLRGRAPRGWRLKVKAPYAKWGTQTFIARLRDMGGQHFQTSTHGGLGYPKRGRPRAGFRDVLWRENFGGDPNPNLAYLLHC